VSDLQSGDRELESCQVNVDSKSGVRDIIKGRARNEKSKYVSIWPWAISSEVFTPPQKNKIECVVCFEHNDWLGLVGLLINSRVIPSTYHSDPFVPHRLKPSHHLFLNSLHEPARVDEGSMKKMRDRECVVHKEMRSKPVNFSFLSWQIR
jgi:hypothetical protein